jgi:hypothetical protein
VKTPECVTPKQSAGRVHGDAHRAQTCRRRSPSRRCKVAGRCRRSSLQTTRPSEGNCRRDYAIAGIMPATTMSVAVSQ